MIGRCVPVLAVMLLAACEEAQVEFTLATSTEEPAPTIAATVGESLADAGFKINIQPSADPSDVLASISNGKLDFAIVEEPSQSIAGVTVIAPLYPTVLHVLHNREGDIDNFRDLLLGAAVYAGPPGGAAHRLLMQLAPDFRLTDRDFRVLDNPWLEAPDVFFVFGGLLSPESLAQLSSYRLFDFARDDDVEGGSIVHGIALRHHNLKPFLLPRDIYYGLANGAVLTLATRTVLVARESLDAQVAYDVAFTLFTNAQSISEPYPLVTHELNDNAQANDLMLPLHPGSRRYIDRDEPGFIERYVDVLALYLTIALTLMSGAFAFYRHRVQVKKDRVDVYYAKLLEIRDAMASDDVDSVANCRRQVIAVQREVMNLLIDERITADAALTAFVEFSNQLINELDRRVWEPAT